MRSPRLNGRPGGGAHVDNSLPNRHFGDYNRPDRPGDGGDHNRPGGGHGGDDNDYYFGWDHPSYGSGVATGIATGLAIGTFVYTLPPNCVYADYGGLAYRRCGDVWYQPNYEDSRVHYVVVKQPY
jgi:hypothetical protein